jgi:hypothetical protein
MNTRRGPKAAEGPEILLAMLALETQPSLNKSIETYAGTEGW